MSCHADFNLPGRCWLKKIQTIFDISKDAYLKYSAFLGSGNGSSPATVAPELCVFFGGDDDTPTHQIKFDGFLLIGFEPKTRQLVESFVASTIGWAVFLTLGTLFKKFGIDPFSATLGLGAGGQAQVSDEADATKAPRRANKIRRSFGSCC
jgi:hypothetical protein